MKKIVIGLLVAVALVNASEKCEKLADLAEAIMDSRQSGVSYRKVLDASADELVRSIVKLAYNKSRFSTEAYKNQAITDFGDYIYKACEEVVELL